MHQGQRVIKKFPLRFVVMLSAFIIFGLIISPTAHATLIDRGNGLVFDDVNNISWIKDADVSGINNWNSQVAWAAGFSLAGFDDFRLASIDELASLYGQLPGGPDRTGNISPLEDIQSVYWSGTEHSTMTSFAWGFAFLTGIQAFGGKGGNTYGWAVRLGDSVTAVPEPSTLLLVGSGAGLLPLFRRRRRN